ncbi:MAG: M12 family metallo-peptidase [Phycisphaerales bacterium]|nr:M12 family metallo-peptidase [Phycisphaerales bacterium]
MSSLLLSLLLGASPLIQSHGSTHVDLPAALALINSVKTNAIAPVSFDNVVLPGETVSFQLTPFRVTNSRTHLASASRVGDLPQTPLGDKPLLLRGTIDGKERSMVYLALSPRGALGLVDTGEGDRYTLAPSDGRTGLQATNLKWHRLEEHGFPPLGVPVCGLEANAPQPPTRSGLASSERLIVEIAVDTDWEFARLFNHDLDAATDYIIALYGAIATIYDRDVNTDLLITWLRVWNTPDDLYNEADPLGPFRDHWNEHMTDVPRDIAQLLTGRVDLPYGGVAWLGVTCSNHGYSVNGYLLGSFVSPDRPAFGNWDITVTAHELGHNCGTYHTHDYGIDTCATGDVKRGSIMSYCHTTTGGNANLDMRFHAVTSQAMREHLEASDCLHVDCNGNWIDDAVDIDSGTSNDANSDGVPDECQDCNDNGEFDSNDIASGFSPDADADGLPDECEADCNRNGLPDDHDIESGASTDAQGNGVPDECEEDCDSDGTSDYTQIQSDMTLDRNRNAQLDDCEDCDGDGTPDLTQLGGSMYVWLTQAESNRLVALHPHTGVEMISTQLSGATGRLLLGLPGPRLIVLHDDGGGTEIDPATGQLLGPFIQPGGSMPTGAMYNGPADEILLIGSGIDAVTRVHVETGQVLGPFTNLTDPQNLCVTPTGNVLIASQQGLTEHDPMTGDLLRVVSEVDQSPTHGLVMLGGLILRTGNDDFIEAIDFASGEHLGPWDTGGLAQGFWQLLDPLTLAIDYLGHVLVVTGSGNTALQRYHHTTGLFQRSFYILQPAAPLPHGLAVMPPSPSDCNGNMRPDTCDIADGVLDDINADGIADTCQCVGDLSGSGAVDVNDLLLLIAHWGTGEGDLNGDGQTDVDDLLLLLNAWGACI